MILFRPVGLHELRLLFESGMAAFPPRLPEQPIFYPVLNFEYAAEIAREWNTKSHSFAGYVTRFAIDDAYAARFPTQTVGARRHAELWVPAGQLDEFNRHLLGPIDVPAAWFGPDFRGHIPDGFALRGKDAVAQFLALEGMHGYSETDFEGEVSANAPAAFLHYPFWAARDFAPEGIGAVRRDEVLAALRRTWAAAHPATPFPTTVP